ncbi:hypothetical protein [Xanthomonas euvesicatoria]|uniref:VgrG-related protein n=1 Tax=Xanthomonas euvesicatoria TaxID=456327 RepID=UPI0031F2F31E
MSTGKGDHGGVSYGVYQLSSKSGTLREYLDQSRYSGEFVRLSPTDAFDAKCTQLARADASFDVPPILTNASRSLSNSDEYVCTPTLLECHAARLTPLVGGRVGCPQWPGRGVHVADTMVARGGHLSDLSA